MRVQERQSAAKPAQRCPTLVLGLGNILLRDEGVGVRVVETLQSRDTPPDVELFDGATAGLDLLDVLADRQRVIVIDAITGDYAPGTVLRLSADDLAPQAGNGLSLHEIGLLHTLALARQLGIAPREVVILGVKPARVDAGLDLSPAIAASLPEIVRLVEAELHNHAPACASQAAQEREG